MPTGTRSLRWLLKRAFWRVTPLPWRKRAVIWLDGVTWLRTKANLPFLLLGDLDQLDGEEYFRFVWSRHVAEASEFAGYLDSDEDGLLPTRHVLLADLTRFFEARGLNPHRDVKSVLDLGCSRGSLLRFVERHVFENADELVGVDLDAQAIAEGTACLARESSKVRLHCRDVTEVGSLLESRRFDLVFCTGVLMYLTHPSAQKVVQWMCDHGTYVVMSDIAHPCVDNGKLERSERRFDRGYLHNLDEMARTAGASVLYHRWDGDRSINGFSIYFVFANRTRLRSLAAPPGGPLLKGLRPGEGLAQPCDPDGRTGR
jgi:2-polyprenyl-3-methyl-5-hydroxy-6-metoxy-1,4-benzoquinol methylase